LKLKRSALRKRKRESKTEALNGAVKAPAVDSTITAQSESHFYLRGTGPRVTTVEQLSRDVGPCLQGDKSEASLIRSGKTTCGAITKTGLVCLVLACSMAAYGKGKARAVFVQDNEIWTVKEDGSGLKQLTKDGRAKHHPVWSPDGHRIAYHLDFDTSGKASLIIIGAELGEVVKTISLQSRSADGVLEINAILHMEWLTSESLAYEGHINPSLSDHRVVELTSGKVIRTASGSCFRWSPDKKKLAVCGWLPHFNAPETLQRYVQINGKTVYTLPNGRLVDYIVGEFSWSADSARIAFLERDETVNRTKLVILETGGGRIIATVPSNIDVTRGVVWLSSEAAVVVRDDKSVWAYSYARRRFVKLSPRLKRVFDQRLRTDGAREKLVVSLKGNEPSWWPKS
jgi:dipeptidyl aminopeptidase/acylaminoacyl peptidase